MFCMISLLLHLYAAVLGGSFYTCELHPVCLVVCVFFKFLLISCLLGLLITERYAVVSNCNCGFVRFSFQVDQFLLSLF